MKARMLLVALLFVAACGKDEDIFGTWRREYTNSDGVAIAEELKVEEERVSLSRKCTLESVKQEASVTASATVDEKSVIIREEKVEAKRLQVAEGDVFCRSSLEPGTWDYSIENDKLELKNIVSDEVQDFERLN